MFLVPRIFLVRTPPQKKIWTGVLKFGVLLIVVQIFALFGQCSSEISWQNKKKMNKNHLQ